MKIIKPVAITDAMLSSNIPEPDTGETVWTAGTYSLGTQRILTSTHLIYEVVASGGTSDAPDAGAAKTVPTWIIVGPTNRWAMFDGLIGTDSTRASPIDVSLAAGVAVNAIAVFDIAGASAVTVTMTDPTDGVVFSSTVDLSDNSQVSDWYSYFFEPTVLKTEFVIDGMPSYPGASLNFNISGSASIGVGAVVIGQVVTLGVSNYGTTLKLMDFSVKNRDEFGNFTVTRRRTSKVVEFDVSVDKSRVGYVFNQLSTITTVPTVYFGSNVADDETLIYGYYRDSQINISSPTICSCSIQVEGLA